MAALPPQAERIPSLYAIVLVVLGIALLAGVFGWIALAFNGKELPQGLVSLISLIAGGLIGVLAPQPHS
jgi:hypothetical protein